MLTVFGVATVSARPCDIPGVVRGRIDLSSWNFQENGPIDLSGEWAFYWEKFYDPEDFEAGELDAAPSFLPVPGLWQGRIIEDGSLPAQGYGTYHLRVVLPPGTKKALSLFVTGTLSTGRVWVTPSFSAASGIPGWDKATEAPRHHFMIADFVPSGEEIDIVLQVSNFHNIQGGIKGDIRLGCTMEIHDVINKRRIACAFMGGALFVLCLYHMTLYVMRPSATPNLYFGLFCLSWLMGTVFGPSFGLLMDSLDFTIPWTWYINFSLLPYGLSIPLMLIFYHSLFPKKHGRMVNRIYIISGAAYIAYILITPANAYDPAILLYYVLTPTAYLYLFSCFILDLIRKEDGVWLLAPGYFALGFAEISEFLFDNNIIGSSHQSTSGILIFILAHSLFISIRFTRIFMKMNRLSTKLESTNTRLVELNNLKDDFITRMTHELKTPLAGMVGVSEALLAGSGGTLSGTAQDHLRILVQSGNRLSNLVDDVLDLSRLEHQDITLKKRPINLNAVAQRILALSRLLAQEKGLTIHNRIPHDFPLVSADQDRLDQILFNLVGNSLKFTPQGGNIVISARRDGLRAEIDVADTGIGISPEDRERIFNPYEQISGTGRNTEQGVGLGLAISRRLVELHDGTISVTSEPGRGSTFTITLPLAVDDQEALEPPLSSSSHDSTVAVFRPESPFSLPDADRNDGAAPPGAYQVLVVDDEPVNRHVVASCLRLAGITHRTAADGVTALDMMAQGDRPDMLLLDIMMPGKDGYTVCRELRQTRDASMLPVILLTVKNRVEDIVEGFASGANDYLTKPFSREELLARVTTQLRLKEAYSLLAENLALKSELDSRRKTEQGLRLTQLRLSKMLDSLDDAIAAVNPSLEIAFVNRVFVNLSGCSSTRLLGTPFSKLLAEPHSAGTKAFLNALSDDAAPMEETRTFESVVLKRPDASPVAAAVFLTTVELEGEPLSVMIFRSTGSVSDGRRSALLSVSVLRDLNRNRQRILNLEEALLSLETGDLHKQQAVLEDLKALDTLLTQLSRHISKHGPHNDKRQLAVKVMNLSLSCWEASTATTKAELAEQSGLWNVYLEQDGYYRTQTLDKYLSTGTLPARPRWRNIFATAEFVLANGNPNLPVYRELNIAFDHLKAMA